jgi:hypothetical protein
VSQGSEAATATTVASNSSGEGSLLETESKSSLERVRVFFFSGGSSDIFLVIRFHYFEGNPPNSQGLLIRARHQIQVTGGNAA